jgi:uncharacterized membrane protein
MKKLLIVCSVVAVLYSCSYDNREELSKKEVCQSDSISFAANVQPIINQRCISCHSGQFPEAGISLTTYDQVAKIATGGKLVGVISHSPGFTPMPGDGSKLSDCQISQIKMWVEDGAQNN